MRRCHFTGAIVLAGAVLSVGAASPSWATFPGRNGLIAYTTGNGDETRYRVMTIRPDGTRNRLLLKARAGFDGGPARPQWSPDGRKLLFAQYHRSDDNGRALWSSTASGRGVTRIPLGLGRVDLSAAEGYAWAPDGRRLVFAADGTLYTMSINATRRRVLARGWRPSWSSDGRHIVFERHRMGPAPRYDILSQIFVIRANGTGLRRLTTSDYDSSPTFSPDGKRIVYSRDAAALGRSEWRMVDVSGRRDHLVVAHPWGTPFVYCAPQWSPNGKRLGAVRTSAGATDDRATVAFVTVTPTGRDERVAFDFPLRSLAPSGMCDFSWQPR